MWLQRVYELPSNTSLANLHAGPDFFGPGVFPWGLRSFCKKAGNLPVSDPCIFQCLIVVEEFFQWCREVLVRSQDSYERAQSDPPLNDEITSERVEHEGSQRSQKVVQRLNEEFEAEYFPANFLEFSKACARGPQGAGLDLIFPYLIAQLPPQLPNFLDPGARQHIDPALQFGQQIYLDGKHRQCGSAQNGILNEHEEENRQERAALQDRQGQNISGKPADRLDFLREDRNNFALI